MRGLAVSLIVLALAACGQRQAADTAETAAVAPAANDAEEALAAITPSDYSRSEAWLCRPEVQDACDQDASATVVAPDGKLTIEAFAADPNAPIDCFYVYPTVSLDPTPNSDLVAGEEEKRVALMQAARFGSACRVYAPMYRQTTLTALRAMLSGGSADTNREMAYADVKAAWERYLANDNAGRGVVLIGHSQGAGILQRLIASEIEGKEAYDKLVSALLLGANLAAPDANGAGGSFKEIAPCVSNEDVGCAIAYASFRADVPPPADSLFGRMPGQGAAAVCVNPAQLDGSNGALKAYLPSGDGPATDSMAAPTPWATGATVTTPFVSAPGLLSAQCVSNGGFSYLAITTNGDPTDARTDRIVGDVITNGQPQPRWGLHLIDPNLALGNLVDIVKIQTKAYTSREISHAMHPEGILGHSHN